MFGRHFAFALVALIGLSLFESAQADPITITQAKAMAGIGNGDTPGFPVTLNQSGAYIIQSNLSAPSGKNGIEITGDNVSLDMNGFALLPTLSGSSHGIVVRGHFNRVANGSVRYFGLNGIWVTGVSAVIENMQVSNNKANGIDSYPARFTVIRNSLFTGNSYSGISVGEQGRVEGTTSSGNGTFGILCLSWCHLTGNTLSSNGGDGVRATTGFLNDNYIANNAGYGVVDLSAADLGLANNYLLYNYPNDTRQRIGGLDVHPNRCVGKTC